MKKSLKNILAKFSNYPREIKDFIHDVLIIEDEKLNIDHPRVIKPISQKLDKLVDKLINKDESKNREIN